MDEVLLNKNNNIIKHPLEKYDKSHLDAVSHFPEPMQDFFLMKDDLGKIFVLTLALKLKIFKTLESLGNNRSAKVIKEHLKLKINDRHFFDFMDQLFVHGYLEREGILEEALYKNSNYTTKYLLGEEDSSYAGVFSTLYCTLSDFANFESNITKGKEGLYTDCIFKDECATKSFADLWCKTNELNFKNLINNVDFSRFNTVVDIHGVVGMLAYEIKRKFQTPDVITFDNKGFKKLCEEKQKTYQIQGEVRYEYGDLLKDKIPECDCVIAPYTFVNYSQEHKDKIADMIYEQLLPGGTFILMESLIDNERATDSCGLKHSFCNAIHGMEGYAKSYSECHERLEERGFKEIQHIKKGCGYADFIVCRK